MAPRIQLSVSYHKDQGTKETLQSPHDDPFTAFAVKIRKFLLQGEEIEFGKISNLVMKLTHGVYDDLFKSTQEWNRVFNYIPKMQLPVTVRVAGMQLSAENCVDLYLYGELVHSNPEKRKLVETIKATPAVGMYYFFAKAALAEYIHPILNLEIIINEYMRRESLDLSQEGANL